MSLRNEKLNMKLWKMWNFWQFCAVRRHGDPGEGKNPPTLLSTYFRLSGNFFTECKCHWLRFFISNLYMDMFKIMKFHLDREPQFNEHNIKWWEASWCQVVTKVQYWCGHVVVCVCVCVWYFWDIAIISILLVCELHMSIGLATYPWFRHEIPWVMPGNP